MKQIMIVLLAAAIGSAAQAEVLSGGPVRFSTGINHHPGLENLKNEGRIATRGTHPEDVAVAEASSIVPEVVLLDIGLPEMDGFEVARRIRRMPGMESADLELLRSWLSERFPRLS